MSLCPVSVILTKLAVLKLTSISQEVLDSFLSFLVQSHVKACVLRAGFLFNCTLGCV